MRDQTLFDWTFARQGHWPSDVYSLALAEDGGELAGVLGGIPYTFQSQGRQFGWHLACELPLRPDRRRGSAALQLLGMFRRPQYHPVIAFGVNPASIPIYRVMRAEVLPPIPRHFMVLPGSVDRMVNVLRSAYPDWTVERASALARSFLVEGIPDACKFDRTLPHDWDDADWPHLATQHVGAARTEEFISWRYLNHPQFQYRLITVPEGKRHGLAIWRLETIRRKTECGREDVDTIGRLLEILPTSPENAKRLVAVFMRELKDCGAFGADHYGFHGPTRLLLNELGFREVPNEGDGAAIPNRFQPLESKGGVILSAMFVQPGVASCSLSWDCPWYWTKSDSDQDRPN